MGVMSCVRSVGSGIMRHGHERWQNRKHSMLFFIDRQRERLRNLLSVCVEFERAELMQGELFFFSRKCRICTYE